MKRGFNVLCLALATALWGMSIVSQAVGSRYMQPFSFNMTRFVLGTAALLPCFFLRRCRPADKAAARTLLGGGALCGTALFVCINLQQASLHYVPAGNAIFICSLYMVMVPVVKFCLGRRASPLLWTAVVLACAGMWLLSAAGGFSLSRGELLCLGCAAGYTCHILLLERCTPFVEPFALTAVQFAVVAVLSTLAAFAVETPRLADAVAGWRAVLYSGVVAGAVAYTLQAFGQRGYDASAASLLLSLETVFGAAGAWLVLGQAMSAREICGGALVLAAVVLAQLPQKDAAPQG